MFGDIGECDRSKIVSTAEKTKDMIRMSSKHSRTRMSPGL